MIKKTNSKNLVLILVNLCRDREALLKTYLYVKDIPSINEFIDLIIEKVVQKKGIEKPELKKPDLPEDFILRNWLNLYK